MKSKVTSTLSGGEIIFWEPESEEDVVELQRRVQNGEVSDKNSFGDWKEPQDEEPVGLKSWSKESREASIAARKARGKSPVESGGINLEPDAAYTKELVSWCKAEERKLGGFPKTQDAVYALGFRNSDPAVYAMAKYMEEQSDRESMLRALTSQNNWDSGWGLAVGEWKAASELGGSGSMSKMTIEALKPGSDLITGTNWGESIPTTPNKVAAFKARQDFTVAYMRNKYGDTLTLYRGITGKQSGKLTGAVEGSKVDLNVYQLASFTTESYGADDFAYGTKTRHAGAVIEVKVPVEDVWQARELCPRKVISYSDDVGEVVLLGKMPTISGKVESIVRARRPTDV